LEWSKVDRILAQNPGLEQGICRKADPAREGDRAVTIGRLRACKQGMAYA
jgi:hypothetical protein